MDTLAQKTRIPRKITDANSQHELKIDKNNKDKIKTPFNELEMSDGTTKVHFFFTTRVGVGETRFQKAPETNSSHSQVHVCKDLHHLKDLTPPAKQFLVPMT